MTVELTDTNGHKDDLAAVWQSYGFHTSDGILTKMGMPLRRLSGRQRGIQWLSGWQPVMPPPTTWQSPWQPQLSSVTIQVQWHLLDIIAQVYRLSAVHCQMTRYSQRVPGYLTRYSVSANEISFDKKISQWDCVFQIRLGLQENDSPLHLVTSSGFLKA